jgi:hypothetical protein
MHMGDGYRSVGLMLQWVWSGKEDVRSVMAMTGVILLCFAGMLGST